MTAEEADTVVVGAGIIGLACAERLCARGLSVTVVERRRLGEGPTGVSGGLVRAFDLDPAVSRLAADSFALLRRRGWRGRWPAVRGAGHLLLLPPDGVEQARVRAEGLCMAGHAVEVLDAEHVRRRHPDPEAVPDAAIGVWEPDAGWVPAAALARAMARDAHGVVLRERTRATRILRRGDRVCGVATDRGRILAPTVVLAAGVASAGLAGVELPLRARAVGYVRLERPRGWPSRAPAVVDQPSGVWFRPSGDLVLAGAVSDALDVALEVGRDITGIEEARVRAALASRHPRLAAARVVDGVSAHDAVSPAHRGMVRCWERPVGLITATGWNGGGVKQAPAVGIRAAELVGAVLAGHGCPGADLVAPR